MIYDIIVIGAGPAGLTAAIYVRRAEKSVLVIEKANFGGQMTFSPKIENYPGYSAVSGNELAGLFTEQAFAQGAETEFAEVTGIVDDGELKTVVTDSGDFRAKAVIIAAGVKHRTLGLPGEEPLIGRGISFCAVCDGAFYRDKTVAMIGGGNSALQEAILLSESCKKVYVIQNLDYFTGEKRLLAILSEKKNVDIFTGTVVKALGAGGVSPLTLLRGDGTELSLEVDGMFVSIGLLPENKLFAELAELNEQGYFASDESCTTKTPGVFVAGDCRAKSVRQITTATADGASAALAACRYIDKY